MKEVSSNARDPTSGAVACTPLGGPGWTDCPLCTGSPHVTQFPEHTWGGPERKWKTILEFLFVFVFCFLFLIEHNN